MAITTKTKQHGFTLVELMIVVAIVAILAGVAYPSYTEQVRKSGRTDAKIALQQAAQAQEAYFIRNYSYANSMTQMNYTANNAESPEGKYTVSVSSVTPAGCAGTQGANACSGFTLQALPVDNKGQDHDEKCKSFTVTNVGVKASLDKDGVNSADVCW